LVNNLIFKLLLIFFDHLQVCLKLFTNYFIMQLHHLICHFALLLCYICAFFLIYKSRRTSI